MFWGFGRVLVFPRMDAVSAAPNEPQSPMRPFAAIAFLTLMAMTSAIAASAAMAPGDAAEPLPAPQQVEIPSGDGTLRAELYKPDGNGPFPTVIALHGCGGLGGHSEAVQPRYRDWAERLLKEGHAVLLPDSYGSRGIGPQCSERELKVRARRERVEDVVAARQWLIQQAW